jgi:hypothetical protein
MPSANAPSSLRVLVVAEVTDGADLARRVADVGCTVSVADGPEAVEVARRLMPNVVLLGRGHLSFPNRLRELRLGRYPLFVFASVGAESLLRTLNSRATGVGGWVPHPNTFHRTASSPIATV